MGNVSVDNPLSIPAKKFEYDSKAHKNNVKAIEDFAQAVYPQLVPVGSVIAYAGAVLPLGWLVCDGSAVSRSTYYTLFSVIGEIYGAGDGTTTFNLPNFTNRHPTGTTAGTVVTHTHTVTTGAVASGVNSTDSGLGVNYLIKA